MTNGKQFKACVFVEQDADISPLLKILESFDISAEVFSEPDLALSMHNREAFDLLIVQDHPDQGAGLKLINDFLATNWMTSSILICDLDEDTVHERAEGLGILGYVRHFDEATSIKALLNKFRELNKQAGFLRPST